MWNLSQIEDLEIDEAEKEIFNRYKYALAHIGVDFEREDVQDAIRGNLHALETAFQATISSWVRRQKNGQSLEYPSAYLIKVLNNPWPVRDWRDEYMDNPEFKSRCQLWWEKAAESWGTDTRNQLVADVRETESGYEYILFRSERTLPLRTALAWGWERVLTYARYVE